MASPSVTYTFTNGTTADATQVNQNFTDLINGLTDGTKDLSISAITAAGNATFNGNTTIGNASGDDLTITASLASTIPIKTTATYDFGSSTKGLAGLYLGNSTFTTKLATAATASWTFTLPTTTGVAGQVMINSGSGAMEWKYLTADTAAKSADYVITDTDKIRNILMTTGSTTRTVTLPTAADNAGRIITVTKVDSGSGFVTLDGENSETIDGAATKSIFLQFESITVQCDGSGWYIIYYRENNFYRSWTPTFSGLGTVTSNLFWRRSGSTIHISGEVTIGTVSAAIAYFTLPTNFNIDTNVNGTYNKRSYGAIYGLVNTGTFISPSETLGTCYDNSNANRINIIHNIGASNTMTIEVGTNVTSSNRVLSIPLLVVPIAEFA